MNLGDFVLFNNKNLPRINSSSAVLRAVISSPWPTTLVTCMSLSTTAPVVTLTHLTDLSGRMIRNSLVYPGDFIPSKSKSGRSSGCAFVAKNSGYGCFSNSSTGRPQI